MSMKCIKPPESINKRLLSIKLLNEKVEKNNISNI